MLDDDGELQLTRLSGKGRLTLTRTPYNHWSFAFVEMPSLDLKVPPLPLPCGNLAVQVESLFQGRELKRMIPLIVQTFRRIIQRKHVWPNYKIRYRPIFPNPLLQPSPPIGRRQAGMERGGLLQPRLSTSPSRGDWR